MKKLFIIASLIIILSVFINCTALIRTPLSNFRSNHSKYFHGYVYVYSRLEGERKPIQGIRVYPRYCLPDLCTETERAGAMTDENGYFRFRRPDFGIQVLVVEFEGEIIGSFYPFAIGRPRFKYPLFLDKRRADTIMVDMRSKIYATFKQDSRRFGRFVW
jgi:hypothetical protein